MPTTYQIFALLCMLVCSGIVVYILATKGPLVLSYYAWICLIPTFMVAHADIKACPLNQAF